MLQIITMTYEMTYKNCSCLFPEITEYLVNYLVGTYIEALTIKVNSLCYTYD